MDNKVVLRGGGREEHIQKKGGVLAIK
jgi:hypothetical protein